MKERREKLRREQEAADISPCKWAAMNAPMPKDHPPMGKKQEKKGFNFDTVWINLLRAMSIALFYLVL